MIWKNQEFYTKPIKYTIFAFRKLFENNSYAFTRLGHIYIEHYLFSTQFLELSQDITEFQQLIYIGF